MISMKPLAPILLACAFLAASGCAPGEQTPEEKAAAQKLLEEGEQRRLVEQIAAFPSIAAEMVVSLDAKTARDVSDMDSAVAMIRFFDQAARNVRIVEGAAEDSGIQVPADTIAAKDALKAALVRKQRQLFPQMRQTYAAYMSDAVAGTQTNFRAVGARSKTLRAASPSFSSRAVIMEAHQNVMSHATQFRFTRAEYVYSLTGAYDYFEVRGDDDGEVDL